MYIKPFYPISLSFPTMLVSYSNDWGKCRGRLFYFSPDVPFIVQKQPSWSFKSKIGIKKHTTTGQDIGKNVFDHDTSNLTGSPKWLFSQILLLVWSFSN